MLEIWGEPDRIEPAPFYRHLTKDPAFRQDLYQLLIIQLCIPLCHFQHTHLTVAELTLGIF